MIQSPADDLLPMAETIVLTAAELSSMLGIDRKTLYAAASRGEVPCVRIGRRVLFPRETIEKWLTASSTTPPAPAPHSQAKPWQTCSAKARR